MTDAPSHADLLTEIRALREDVTPLVEMQSDLKDVVEVLQALKMGGRGVKWMASIATALLTIGGMMLAVRAMWQSFMGGAT